MIPLAPRHRPLRILCVEEDPLQRRLLDVCLEVLDAETLMSPRAANAVWLFRRHPVDLVMMDIDCHSAEEIAAFEEIRKTPRWGKCVPIIAVTDNNCEWSDADYREAGFAALYLKPIQPTRLFTVMDEVLREHGLPPLLDRPSSRPLPVPHIA